MRIAQVKYCPGMCVAAACGSGTEVTGVRPPVADPMHVISNCLNIVIGIRIKMVSALPMISCSLNNMEQVRNDAYRNERLTDIVEINAPWVTAAVCKHLKNVPRRVITPNAGIDRLS